LAVAPALAGVDAKLLAPCTAGAPEQAPVRAIPQANVINRFISMFLGGMDCNRCARVKTL
jgi:hypothetical protein